eukprot:1571901-Amphidinium_carterae.1
MEGSLQEGQDLVIQLSDPGVTHRAREISYEVRVLCQKAAAQNMYGYVSGRAIDRTVLNESVECNQSLLKGVRVRFEERMNMAGDTYRHRSF